MTAKLNKKKFFKWVSISALSFGALSMPVGLVLACNRTSMVETPVWYNGQLFSSTYDLGEYAKQNMTKMPATVDQSRWLIKDGNANRTFNSPAELTNFLRLNYINKTQSYVDNSFYDRLDGDRLTNAPLTKDATQIKQVYRGHDEAVYLSEAEAQDSLLEEHELYFYDSHYFANKADLNAYLRSNEFDSESLIVRGEVLTIQKQDKSLRQSSVIDQATSSSPSFSLSNFVSANAERVYGPNSKAVSLLTPEDIDLADVPYLQVANTNGKASYVMDLKSDVEGFLIGPYVLEGPLDPTTTVLQRAHWKASNVNYETTAYAQDLEALALDSVINMNLANAGYSSFTQILTSDLSRDAAFVTYNETHPVFLSNDESAVPEQTVYDGSSFNNALTKYYVNIANSASQASLKTALIQTEQNLANGKSFGALKSLSALRSWLISQVLFNRLAVSLVPMINAQFDKAARYINYLLHQSLDALISKKAQSFNLARVFNFAKSQSFGENPAAYLYALKNGKLITNDEQGSAVPEAKELLMAAPFVIGVFSYYNARTETIERVLKNYENALVRYNAIVSGNNNYSNAYKDALTKPTRPVINYELPQSIESITTEAQRQQAEVAVLVGAAKNLAEFERNDTLGVNTLRVSDANFDEFKAKVNLFLKVQSVSTANLVPKDASKWNFADFGDKLKTYQQEESVVTEARQVVQAVLNETKFISSNVDALYKSIEVSTGGILKVFNTVREKVFGFENLKSLESLTNLLKMASAVLAVLVVALQVIDIILGLIGRKVIDTYHYDYDRGAVNYYWNGGSHQERSIFGFKFNTDVNSMPEAALIHPVVIANATQSDAYYYEGNFYPNLLTLRQAFLNSLKNNEHQVLTSYEIKLVNATQSGTNFTPIRRSKLSDLVAAVVNKIKAEPNLKTRLNLTPQGFFDNAALAISERISALTESLKPLTIVQMPIINEFQKLERLPYLVPATNDRPLWKAEVPNVEKAAQITARSYLIFDPNTNLSYAQPSAISRTVREEFSAKFNIETKDVLVSQLHQSSRFNALHNVANATGERTYDLQNIFEVTSPRGHIERFINEGAALGWLLAALDFQVIANIGPGEVIVIDEVVYASISEFVSKVLLSQEKHRSKELHV